MPATLYIDDISELPEVFAAVEEDFHLIDYQPLMAKELDPLADWHRGLFDRQESPDGSAWKPNARSTIERKGHDKVLRGLRRLEPLTKAVRELRRAFKKNHRIRTAARFERFRLSNSLTLKANHSVDDAIREVVGDSKGAALSFGTTVEYSVFHDRGSSRYPARQHVGIDGNYLDDMVERVADYTINELAKG